MLGAGISVLTSKHLSYVKPSKIFRSSHLGFPDILVTSKCFSHDDFVFFFACFFKAPLLMSEEEKLCSKNAHDFASTIVQEPSANWDVLTEKLYIRAWPVPPTEYHKFSDNVVLLLHTPRKLRLLIDCLPLLREALPRTAHYSIISIILLCLKMFNVSTFRNALADGLLLLGDLRYFEAMVFF